MFKMRMNQITTHFFHIFEKKYIDSIQQQQQ